MTNHSPYLEFAPALMTRDVAAYYLSASIREVDYLRAAGKLQAVGDGKRVKFRRVDIDTYLGTLQSRHSVDQENVRHLSH